MRILFIGTGSIGKKHISLLKECGNHTVIAYQRIKNKVTPGVDDYVDSLTDLANAKIDCAVICNPSALHVETALILARQKIPFLIEKPVCVDTCKIEMLQKLVAKNRLPVLVGFNLRYHALFSKMKELVDRRVLGQPLSLVIETGYYLPKWRSGDYKKCYSSKKNLGGGVIFDLTHEIDIAMQLMGGVNEVSCVKGRISPLKTLSEDVAEISLIHKKKRFSHIHVDYIQKSYTRTIKMICEEGEIIWDYDGGTLVVDDGKRKKIVREPKRYSRDNTFKNQLKHWFSVIEDKEKPYVSLKQGVAVSMVAIAAHQSAEMKKVISV